MIILKDDRIRSIIKLASQSLSGYKLQIVILTILGFVGGILETIGVTTLIPLFYFAANKSQETAVDPVSQIIEKFFLYFNINFEVKYLLIFISSLFVLRAVTLVLISYIKAKIITDYEEKIRNNVFRNTLGSSWSYLSKQKVGHLETVLMTDVRTGSIVIEQVSNLVIVSISLAIYILVAINISIEITLFALIFGLILFLFFKPLIYKSKIASGKMEKANKEVAHYVNENIIGMKTVKSMNVNEEVVKIGAEYFSRLKKLAIKIFLLRHINSALIQPMSLIFICIIFAFSYKSPDFNIAYLVVIIYLVHRIFSYLQQLQSNLHVTSEIVPFLKSALDHSEQAEKNKEPKGGSASFDFEDKLEFKNVNFSYNKENTVLSNVNFSIKKGEMVGLIGPSGAGKTTIVDLILRLFEPASGEIILDNKDISDINMKDWRKNIGYISQDIFLMNDTIANNIKFYDNSITNKEMEKAAKMANIYNFIDSSPGKFSTIVGERGLALSGGQRQRIIIARILARQPKFLILDEATSALDNESEVQVQKVIENLKNKITVLVIAHRLSTVANSDKIIILKNGKIIEEGVPSKMLNNQDSYFYKMHNLRK